MVQKWQPEHVVTPGLARQLIEQQFPVIAPAHVEVLGEGFDNTVYQVNQDYVFRFPRREVAVELLHTEGQLLPALADVLPIATPQPLFYGQPDEAYPWPFIGFRMIKGMMPERVAEPNRFKAARPLAEFLRVLHSFPVQEAVQRGVPPTDTIKRLDLAYRKPQMQENFSKAVALRLIQDAQDLERYITDLEIEEVPQQKALVHGDLHIRNFLIDQEGCVTGVVDWGDTHIGHPAVDLAVAFMYLPAEGRRVFFETYGEVDRRVKELARFRAIHISLLLLLYAHDQGQEQLVEAAKASLWQALANESN